MKRKRDFFEGEPSPFDAWSGFEDEPRLPKIFSPEEDDTKKQSGGFEVARFILMLAMAVTASVLIFVIILMAVGNDRATGLETPTFSDDEEWRGAFASREIYDCAIDCSVKLRGEQGTQTREWSGVIISTDGWIATSGSAVDRAAKGRIYAVLSDGREYGVESFFKQGDTAALKIDASGLDAVTLSRRDMQAGESVLSVSEGRDVLCGFVCGADAQSFNIPLSSGGDGAPVFDNEGGLIGIAQATENALTWQCSREDLENILIKIQND